VTINISATGGAPVFNFSGPINMTGTSLTFGNGTYNMAAGIELTNGGSSVSFGSGTFNIGEGAFSCNSSTDYSICNNGTSLRFGGPSTFNIQGGVFNKGGSTLALGSGTTNSFDIGKASDGNSFVQGSGATTTFADATGAGDVFQMEGNVNLASSGGNCLTLSAATNHYIGGYFSSGGGTVMGSGVYTIEGYFALGAGNGGDVTCNGAAVGLNGNNVSLVIGGASTISESVGGVTQNLSFYMGAGFSNVTLMAPTTGPTANLAVVGPQSGSNGAALSAGASGADFSGAFYFPTEAVTMDGGSSLGSFGANQCLMLVGSQVSLSGGAALASSCQGFGAGTTSSVVLVQ
jgi:hypothetical protein